MGTLILQNIESTYYARKAKKKKRRGHLQVLILTGRVNRGGEVGIQVWHLGIKSGSTDLGQEVITI